MWDFKSGDLVWFDPGLGFLLPGQVCDFSRTAQVVTIEAEMNEKKQTFTIDDMSNIHKRQDLGERGVEDMVDLTDLNEASILWNLKLRYGNEEIYTFIGNILVALNPYKLFNMYGLEEVKKYKGQILGTLPPHLFAIGSASYAKMSKERENQVIIISGESGSGKTETSKLLMQYLAAVNKAASNIVTEQILEANPLLESFGNAKTVKNNNSSRFGKYLEIYFKDGVITGARTTEYLLEKSRIVTQALDERNYHVYYELLSGLSDQEKEKYGLQTADKYFYLNQGGSTEIDGKDDEQDFRFLLAAMQVLGFTNEEQDTIFRILASVLHLGNIYFHRKQLKHGQEGVEIGSDAEIRWISHLLQLPLDGILKSVTFKTTETRNERVFTALNIDQALDSRDVLAKSLYSSLFSWLVHRINSMVYKGSRRTTLALLDIFGFEEFKENSFEQLCINFANETLHSFFTKYVFKLEQQEYQKEKIDWRSIPCPDNQNVLDLIARKPDGILPLLDDESNFPKASDHSFLEKCHYNHALNDVYSRPRMSSMEFGVRHYAGQVWYTVDGFLDKNRDTLRPDVLDLLASSKIGMISRMFNDLRSTTELTKTYNRGDGRFITMKPRAPTVATRFQNSLTSLLETMSRCQPWFIRCIKPNNEKAAMKFDMSVVLQQLRYSGVLETVHIRQIGYSVRMKYNSFVSRYRCLISRRFQTRHKSNKEVTQMIFDAIPDSNKQYQLGTTKVFMRESLERTLEKERVQLLRGAVVTVQRYARGYLVRKRLRKAHTSAITIQSAYRGYRCRNEYLKVRKGIERAQATWRMKNQKREYVKMKEMMARKREAERVAAVERVRREGIERKNRLAAGIHLLEIPSQLNQVFTKLDGWQPPQSEKNVSKPNEIPIGGWKPIRLPADLDHFSFNKFTNIYFRAHVWGMKKDPVKTPFLPKSSESEFQESLAIFKLILRYMNDDSLSGKREKVLSDYIIQKGLADESLRDEILCQLCNQTWNNDNPVSRQKAWLLMADTLSAFSASHILYKYLLKYVSDHAPEQFRGTCQSKLLRSAFIEPQNCRTYPPTYLEHKANDNQASIALTANFPDGDTKTAYLDSWTSGEEFAADLLKSKSIDQNHGWTVELVDDGDIFELNGTDYVMDLIAETEVAPSFPTCKSYFLCSPDKSKGNRKGHVIRESRNMMETEMDIEISSDVYRSHENAGSQARTGSRENVGLKYTDHHGNTIASHHNSVQSLDRNSINLSKSSKLNQRYLQGQNVQDLQLSEKSRLNKRYASRVEGGKQVKNKRLEPQVLPLSKRSLSLQELGLATSALNERYFQTRRQLQKSISVTSEMDEVSKNTLKGANDFKEPENPLKSQKSAFLKSQLRSSSRSSSSTISSETSTNGRHEMKRLGQSSESLNSRYIKYPAKQNGKNGLNTYSQSTKAYIDKSDRINSENYGYTRSSAMSDTSEAPSLASHVRNVKIPSHTSDLDQYLDDLFNPVLDGNLDELSDARSLAASIKGGFDVLQNIDIDFSGLESLTESVAVTASMKGGGAKTGTESSGPDVNVTSNTAGNAFTNVAGMTVPMVDTSQVIQQQLVHQQMIQRAFLASAVQQNLQIQQQLLQQNQALQQLLHTDESTSLPAIASESGNQSLILTDEHDITSLKIISPQSLAGTKIVSKNGVPPPPPPPPPPPSPPPNDGSYPDVFGRAKTVRIGKWRWPPPREDGQENGGNSFLEFKMKKHTGKQEAKEEFEIKEKKVPIPPIRTTSVENREQPVQSNSNIVEKSKSRVAPAVLIESKADANVGKLRISSEMKAKLEQLTSDQSVRTGKTASREKLNQSMDDITEASVKKLSEQRKTLLEQQLMGSMRLPPSSEFKTSIIDPSKGLPAPQNEQVLESDGLVKIEGRFAPHRRSGGREVRERRDELGPNRENEKSDEPSNSRISGDFFDESQYEGSTTSADRKVKRMSVPPPPPPSHGRSNGSVPRGPPSVATSSTYYQSSAAIRQGCSRNSLEQSSCVDSSTTIGENIRTKLYPLDKSVCLTYSKVNWELRLRKEFFTPSEKIDDPTSLHMIFCQIVRDAFSGPMMRLSREERSQIQAQLSMNGISTENFVTNPPKLSIQSSIVELVKTFPVYFSRLFPVYGGRNFPSIHFLAITHSCLRFLRREKENLQVIDTLNFDVIADVTTPRRTAIQILLKSGSWITLFSPKANQIRNLIEQFVMDTVRNEFEFVSAIEDHDVKDASLLRFKRGDIIRIIQWKQVPKGWFFGVLESGEGGIFPSEFVVPLPSSQVRRLIQNMINGTNGYHKQNGHHSQRSFSSVEEEIQESSCWIENKESESQVEDTKSDGTQGSQLQDGKFSLLQFALFNFKEAVEKYELVRNKDGSVNESANFLESLKAKKKKKSGKDGSDWTWRELSDLVKFTSSPMSNSLLKLNSNELTKLAVDCFISIMRYMGDHPMAKGQTEVDCVYTVLVNCHRYPQLRDEIYCQMMKQTTNNKSSNSESCRRGWRLFSIIAAYFDCSENLRPYLLKYLETAAYDKRRMYHNMSSLCLHNLRKTFRFGGRKNVPSIEEIAAISAGRNSKRQMYRLPGGTERIINTTSTTVVLDVIEEICAMLNVRDPLEIEEFSLYCIVEGDPYTMPLNKDEYILDVTTELLKNSQVFYLIFCRSVWFYPLRLESQLYIEVVFNQVAPDYLEGLLLVTPDDKIPEESIPDISRMAALLHRAADMEHNPTRDEVKYLLPKPVLPMREIRPPQWVEMVQSHWEDMSSLTTIEAKAQCLDILQKWSLFGSCFFAIKMIQNDSTSHADHILALNRDGVQFLHVVSHETVWRYSYAEVISTRKVRSEDGTLYLDMKTGNLMVQKITRIQTDQAHEISRLIRQYIDIQSSEKGETPPNIVTLSRNAAISSHK